MAAEVLQAVIVWGALGSALACAILRICYEGGAENGEAAPARWTDLIEAAPAEDAAPGDST